jgi:gluconolactonase
MTAYSSDPVPAASPRETIGAIRRDSPALDALIASDARIEKLADGFIWSEGPVWVPDEGGYLLFSDVPGNRMYRWSEREGLSVFLDPSGYDGPPTTLFREPGSNGLIPGPAGTILMADHGNRAVARLDLATRRKTFLATHYRGRDRKSTRLNSSHNR